MNRLNISWFEKELDKITEGVKITPTVYEDVLDYETSNSELKDLAEKILDQMDLIEDTLSEALYQIKELDHLMEQFDDVKEGGNDYEE